MLYKCIPEEIMTVLGDLVDELRKEESHIDTENFIAYFRNKMTCIPSKVISLFNQYLGVTSRPKCFDENTFSVIFFFFGLIAVSRSCALTRGGLLGRKEKMFGRGLKRILRYLFGCLV
jgi:hypothetical protein